MLRDILVHVDPTDGGRRRLVYALGMADTFGARLTGVHVRAPPDLEPMYKPSHVDDVLKAQDARLALSAEASAELFRSVTASATNPVRWRAVCGNLAQSLASKARYADLVIVGQYEHEGAYEHHPFTLAVDLVQIAGAPIIVTPKEVGPPGVRHIALAWDGSAQCVRALHDAIPFMERATDVAIITVDGDGAARDRVKADIRDLTDHLEQHGIGAGCIRSVLEEGQHTSAILAEMRAGGFDLLVMGAFGRSAWAELFFGGTTYDVLQSSPLPVFISR
ncbi:MAG: universal stress protein [Caulobacteraceae bacterium]|nr:universal stress protein [Caulobacteraceae bacterium]